MNNRILSIDYGQKRIGLAISDEYARMALPYEMIENKSLKFIIKQIDKIVQEEEVGKIVVGAPKSLDGKDGNKLELDKFVSKLKKIIGLPVVLFDERLTSKAADRFKLIGDVKESGWRDKVAAAIVLQDYLDQLKVKN